MMSALAFAVRQTGHRRLFTRHPSSLPRLAAAALLLGGALAATPAAAGTEEEAVAFVRQLGDEAVRLLASDDGSAEGRVRAFQGLLTDRFDLPAVSRFVLGRSWRSASPDQQQRFERLFSDFIVVTYAARFRGYSGETLNVQAASVQDDQRILVRSEVRRAAGPPVKVDWRLARSEQGLRVVDVIVEGVSMALTHRSEFSSVILRDGVEGLLAQLEKRTEAGRQAALGTPPRS